MKILETTIQRHWWNGLRLLAISLMPVAALSTASAQNFTWTGASNVNWGLAANWTPGGFNIAGGSNYVLQFNSASTAYNANNNTAAIIVNKLVYETGAGTEAITSNMNTGALQFAANGGINPSIVQNSGAQVFHAGNIGFNLLNDLVLTGTGSGLVTIGTPVAGVGGLVVDGNAKYAITRSNTFTGGVVLKSGELRAGTGTGAENALGSGTLSLEGGKISSISTTTTKNLVNNVTVKTDAHVRVGDTVNSGDVVFAGTATFEDNAVLTAESKAIFSGALTMGENVTFVQEGGAAFTLSNLDIANNVTLNLQLGGNPLVITGALDNGGDGLLRFVLNGGTAGETYTLATFGSVNLTYSDLSLLSSDLALDTSFGTNGWFLDSSSLQVRVIPEPSTLMGVCIGLLLLFCRSCARRKQSL